jgi:hypothetical protein
MSTIDASYGICTPFIQHTVRTGVANDESQAVAVRQMEEHRRQWEEIINTKLIEWGRHPDQLEDDDLIPPSKSVVQTAIQIAQGARDARRIPPDWIIPDGDGGIVFEWREANRAVKLELLDDGSAECLFFDHDRLLFRETLCE